MRRIKAINQVALSPTIYASRVDTEATGVLNAELVIPTDKEEYAVDMEAIPERIGNTAQIPSTALTAVENEVLDLSEDESIVLEVHLEHKGETVSRPQKPNECLKNCSVRGRLKEHIKFWERIEAPAFIIDTIREGYKIPFLVVPPYCVKRNNKTANLHEEFVMEAIEELLEGDMICEVGCREDLHVVNPLSVSVQSSGKKRLILDLRIVNKCVLKQKFKFEDHKKALEYFVQGGYATKFDLKSGYHHVDIFPEHRQYLGFCWSFQGGVERYFMFNVLPFGLSSAPYIFTKLLRPLVKLWRCRGLHTVLYLDDGINFEQSMEIANYASHHMQGDLFAAGFVVNQEKSVWEPTQNLEWLGINWDAKGGVISVREKRIVKAKRLLVNALDKPCKSARELAAIVGSIMSMSAVLGRLSCIMTRHCQITVAIADDWDTQHDLDNYCILELEFWHENLVNVNSKFCFNRVVHNKMIYSDASDHACGALVKGADELICHKMFTEEEASYSSTHRELIAILYSLEAFGETLYDSKIKWFTDNQSTARIVEVGSMKMKLHLLAYKIFSHCLEHNIDFYIDWIPRTMNTQADFISKIRDCDDWQISWELFQELDKLWGPHTLDCFASFYNAKTSRFFSRFWNPGCAGVDAFYHSWHGENCLIVPPVNIVIQVLNYMNTQNIVGTLIVPAWPSAVFWPVLWQRYGTYISEYRYYKGAENCIHGRNTKSVLGSPEWNGYLIAIRLSFL